MALILRSPPTSLATKKRHHSSLYPPSHNLPSYPKLKYFTPKSQDTSSSTSKPPETPKPTDSTASSSAVAPPKPSSGLGFGSSTSAKPAPVPTVSKKKQKSRKERASIIRRIKPLEKPSFAAQATEVSDKEPTQNESAFIIAWLGLGAIILTQGLILSASGFLPEEWDRFFTKYLYPTFTPTVGLFVAGTVAYGVLKYLQNEELKKGNGN